MATEATIRLVKLLSEPIHGLPEVCSRSIAERVVARLVVHPDVVTAALDMPDPQSFQELVLDRNNLMQALSMVLMETGPVVIPEKVLVENPDLTLHKEDWPLGGVKLSATKAIKVVGQG